MPVCTIAKNAKGYRDSSLNQDIKECLQVSQTVVRIENKGQERGEEIKDQGQAGSTGQEGLTVKVDGCFSTRLNFF